jgi:hypothetical protein
MKVQERAVGSWMIVRGVGLASCMQRHLRMQLNSHRYQEAKQRTGATMTSARCLRVRREREDKAIKAWPLSPLPKGVGQIVLET